MHAMQYMLIRNAVVTLGFLLLCLVAITLSVYFYATIFGYRNFTVFVLPTIVTILPGFVFFMGLGHLAGRTHSGLLYALIPVSFAISFVPQPGVLDFFGGGYYNNSPLELPIGVGGEPVFVFSGAFLAVRALYLIIGGVLWIISIRTNRRKAA